MPEHALVRQPQRGFRSRIFVKPPRSVNWRFRPLQRDYGYAYDYETIFPRDLRLLEPQLRYSQWGQQRVLDLGGGEGRLCRELVQAGCSTYYLDNSSDMMARARVALKDLGDNIHWIQQDVLQLRLPVRFDHVVSLGNALEFVAEDRLPQAISRVREVLKPGGKAWLELHSLDFWSQTPGWLSNQWQFQERFFVGRRRYFVWHRTSPREPGLLRWEHAVSHDGVRYVRLQADLTLLPDTRWQRLFDDAGLILHRKHPVRFGQGPANKWIYELSRPSP